MGSAWLRLKGLWKNGFWGGAGQGDVEQQYFHNPLLEPEPCWRALPPMVQCVVFEFLDPVTLNRLRRVAKYERHLVENIYGFDVAIPRRNWTAELICDSKIKKVLDGMEGKVIRGIDLTAISPAPQGFPFEKCISYPQSLLYAKFSYVSVDLLYKFLSECYYMKTLKYETSIYRPIPTGPISLILLRAHFEPALAPPTNQVFMNKIAQELPIPVFQLPYLTSLTLRLQHTFAPLGSDWANVLYILLTVTPVNLNFLKFKLESDKTVYQNAAVLIFCILGEFMGKLENLQKFKYESSVFLEDFGTAHNGLDVINSLPVLTALINRYGSEKLKVVHRLENDRRFLMRAQDFVGHVASNLKTLKCVDLAAGINFQEDQVFRAFITKPPALIKVRLFDSFSQDRPFLNNINNQPIIDLSLHRSLLPQPRADNENHISSQASLEELFIALLSDAQTLPRVSLESMLQAFPALTRLMLDHERTGSEPPEQVNNYASAQETRGGAVQVVYGKRAIQFPDITIQIEHPVDVQIFSRLRCLVLINMHMFSRDIPKLIVCKNLKLLVLEIPPGFHHNLFGIESRHLLMLMANLRKLDSIEVSGILFPEGRNNRLARRHRSTLQMIGKLDKKSFSITKNI